MHRDWGVRGCVFWLAALGVAAGFLLDSGPAVGAQRVDSAQARPAIDEAALLKLVRDDKADAALRRDAATNLFNGGSPEAEQALLTELKMTVDAGLRRAIIQGLRNSRSPSPAAGGVLLSLAKELDPAMLDDAADVLGRSTEPGQTRNIATLAADREVHVNTRVICTSALGYHRTQPAAKAIMPLVDSTQPAPVRAAAFASLARLSGLDEYGTDRARWQAWWSQAKAMSENEWRDHLVANFARRGDALARQRAVLQERLTTALRQRYRAVNKEERETVLIAMLADPLEAVRELSLELVREIVNTEQVGVTLTASLVTRLNDTSPAIRTGATLLLRDLKNADAADIIATRLADGTERDPGVLRAYLLMMKRQPRLGAVGPAIALLDDPIIRSEAAGVILAAFDNTPRLVGKEQSQRVAETLRRQLASEDLPEPRFVELLGRVASPDDWARIAQWLDHETDAVKEAAARTWAASDRTLAPLAQRAGDPIIQAIVIPAATQRGETPETLFGLIEHKPKSEQLAAAWGRALVAMASRIDDPEAIVKADARLQKQNESTDLRLQVLSAAIDRLLLRLPADVIGNGSERQVYTIQLIDLLLARAEARLASGDTKASLADLERVSALKVDLAVSQQNRHELIGLHARVIAGDLDDAFAKAGKYFNGGPDADDAAMRNKVIDLLLACADRCVTAKQVERAGQIITRLRARIPRPVPLELETRLAVVEARIKAGQ